MRVGLDPTYVAEAFTRAAALPRLHALVVARGGEVRAEKRFRGPSLDTPVNVKSISKSLVSLLVGIAIDRGLLHGTDQAIAPFFPEHARHIHDPRFQRVRIGDLLSMRSGLTRTSGEGYGGWVKHRDWLRHVLRAPMIAEPGEAMNYSTGNTHVLSAILTRATGMSTHAFAREALAEPLGIALPRWERDPSGLYIGGNQMKLSPHALVRIGELVRNEGRHEGTQVVSAAWMRDALMPRTRSMFSGQLYGYGWFVSEVEGHPMVFAWGYGGQYIFVVPDLALTVVTTSATHGGRDFDHLWAIQGILADCVKAAVQADLAGSG
ncbi:MAG: serine hydrolase [Polyangiales bacterium]